MADLDLSTPHIRGDLVFTRPFNLVQMFQDQMTVCDVVSVTSSIQQ